MQFSGEISQIVCWCPPPLWDWHPLFWENLDPPLNMKSPSTNPPPPSFRAALNARRDSSNLHLLPFNFKLNNDQIDVSEYITEDLIKRNEFLDLDLAVLN